MEGVIEEINNAKKWSWYLALRECGIKCPKKGTLKYLKVKMVQERIYYEYKYGENSEEYWENNEYYDKYWEIIYDRMRAKEEMLVDPIYMEVFEYYPVYRRILKEFNPENSDENYNLSNILKIIDEKYDEIEKGIDEKIGSLFIDRFQYIKFEKEYILKYDKGCNKVYEKYPVYKRIIEEFNEEKRDDDYNLENLVRIIYEKLEKIEYGVDDDYEDDYENEDDYDYEGEYDYEDDENYDIDNEDEDDE